MAVFIKLHLAMYNLLTWVVWAPGHGMGGKEGKSQSVLRLCRWSS